MRILNGRRCFLLVVLVVLVVVELPLLPLPLPLLPLLLPLLPLRQNECCFIHECTSY